MTTNQLTDLVYNKAKSLHYQQAALAYADDTTQIARSKTELQRIVNISREFYKINNIEINSKKSELLVLNASKKNVKKDEQYSISMGKKKEDTVYAKKDTNSFRHLGVWISNKNNKICSLNIIRNEINKICKAIKWKRVSTSQLVYINNNVLLPSVEYRLQTVFLTKSTCDKLQRPIWILIKNKLGLASTTANSICSHIRFLGLRLIQQNQLAYYFTEQ